MFSKEFPEKFLQIEEELDLFNKKIDGVYFWERIRTQVYYKVSIEKNILEKAHSSTERSFFSVVKFLAMGLKNIFFKNPFFSSPKDILFFSSARRKLQEDGKWHNIFFDPLIDELSSKVSYMLIEEHFLGKHFLPSKTENLYYFDFLSSFSSFFRELKFNKIHFTKDEKTIITRLKDKIKKEFDIKIDLEEILRKELVVRKRTIFLYRILLKRIKPKIAIITTSYGKETFIEACKEMKIPVVEFQHGAIHKYHMGWSYKGEKRVKRNFPDYFFAFGNFWKNCLEFPIKEERIISVGYPYLEKEASRYNDVEKKNQILFISQGTVGKQLSQFAVELDKKLKGKYNIAYKLHPGEYKRWKKEYPWLLDTGINVLEEDIPLYRLFAESKIQVGVNSTAIYEGLFFGLKTYLIKLPGIEIMNYLVEKKYVKLLSSVEELLFFEKEKERLKIESDYFFEKESLKKITNNLKKIYENIACSG